MSSLRRKQATFAQLALIAALAASGLPGAAAQAALLSELLSGQWIDAGGARFSNWQLVGVDATAAPPNLSLITVVPVTNDSMQPGLQFGGGGQLATTGVDGMDLQLQYRVQAIGAASSFAGQSVAINGLSFGGPGGVASISQETTSTGGVILGSAVAFADNAAGVLQQVSAASFPPRLNVDASLNIFLQGTAGSDAISLSTFTVRFNQTGPTSLAGDFNHDHDVNGVDFLIWQRGGSPNPLSAQDLALWKSNLGQSISVTPAGSAAPEPCGLDLLLQSVAAVFVALRGVKNNACRQPHNLR